MDSRENLHPLWSDLSARADAARKEFRESGGYTSDRVKFIRVMRRLGFDSNGIEHEIRENNPLNKGGPGS